MASLTKRVIGFAIHCNGEFISGSERHRPGSFGLGVKVYRTENAAKAIIKVKIRNTQAKMKEWYDSAAMFQTGYYNQLLNHLTKLESSVVIPVYVEF